METYCTSFRIVEVYSKCKDRNGCGLAIRLIPMDHIPHVTPRAVTQFCCFALHISAYIPLTCPEDGSRRLDQTSMYVYTYVRTQFGRLRQHNCRGFRCAVRSFGPTLLEVGRSSWKRGGYDTNNDITDSERDDHQPSIRTSAIPHLTVLFIEHRRDLIIHNGQHGTYQDPRHGTHAVKHYDHRRYHQWDRDCPNMRVCRPCVSSYKARRTHM
jgi:hypothetical protein